MSECKLRSTGIECSRSCVHPEQNLIIELTHMNRSLTIKYSMKIINQKVYFRIIWSVNNSNMYMCKENMRMQGRLCNRIQGLVQVFISWVNLFIQSLINQILETIINTVVSHQVEERSLEHNFSKLRAHCSAILWFVTCWSPRPWCSRSRSLGPRTGWT